MVSYSRLQMLQSWFVGIGLLMHACGAESSPDGTGEQEARGEVGAVAVQAWGTGEGDAGRPCFRKSKALSKFF